MSRSLLYQHTPGGGGLFEVGEGGQRAAAERRARAETFGLVQPDGGLGERVVQGISDAADRRDQPGQHECLAESHRGVLRTRVRVVDRAAVQRMSLPATVGRGLPHGAFDERGVLGQRAFPSRQSARRTRR